MGNSIEELKQKALWLRQQVLKMTCGAGAGHVAPSFSCAEILVSLYQGRILKVDHRNPKWAKRDRFILSKGQAAVGLYAVLADMGFFPIGELSSFTNNGSRLGGHTEDTIPGVEAFTGSLGHGLSLGCGLALAAKIDRKDFLTVVLHGDGECHEGSVWEAAMFAAFHKLNNLVVIIDRNGQSAIDFIEEYISLNPLSDKWTSFGWDVVQINGHSISQILEAFKEVRYQETDKPLVIIAETIKGKGVSFMERKPIWHYRIPVGDELDVAYQELKMGNRING